MATEIFSNPSFEDKRTFLTTVVSLLNEIEQRELAAYNASGLKEDKIGVLQHAVGLRQLQDAVTQSRLALEQDPNLPLTDAYAAIRLYCDRSA
jgi:hypothetical protein